MSDTSLVARPNDAHEFGLEIFADHSAVIADFLSGLHEAYAGSAADIKKFSDFLAERAAFSAQRAQEFADMAASDARYGDSRWYSAMRDKFNGDAMTFSSVSLREGANAVSAKLLAVGMGIGGNLLDAAELLAHAQAGDWNAVERDLVTILVGSTVAAALAPVVAAGATAAGFSTVTAFLLGGISIGGAMAGIDKVLDRNFRPSRSISAP